MKKCRGTPVLLAALVLLPLVWPREVQALGLGPGLAKIENIRPGEPIDLKKQYKFVYFVPNDTNEEQVLNLTCVKPSMVLKDWEAGYEEVPDLKWFRLEKNNLVIPAHSQEDVGLIIDVPDKLENYNRKWLLAIRLGMGSVSGSGTGSVGLAVVARLQLETVPSVDAGTDLGGPIGTLPSATDLEVAPGERFSTTFVLRDNLAEKLVCMPERLVQVVNNEEIKFDRYVSNQCKELLKESWLETKYEPFTLKPGKDTKYKITGRVPVGAKPGEKWEEMVFIRGDKEQTAGNEKTACPIRTFLRVRLSIKAPGQ
jgi:hypothetical protein